MALGLTGLLKVAVNKKDGATYSKTLLLQSNRILDFERDTGTGLCNFWYDTGPFDLKRPASLYSCSAYTVASLDWAINRSDTTQNRFFVHCMRERKQGHTEVKRDKMVKLYAGQILFGYDLASGLGSYIWITRGNDVYRWETSHTITDLVRAASKSASLSRSAMS